MMDSDKSDNSESNATVKRLHEDSPDEKSEHPSKRLRSKTPDLPETVDSKKDLIVQVTNGNSSNSEKKTMIAKVEDEHKNGEAMTTDDDTAIDTEGDDVAEVGTESVELDRKIEDVKMDKEEEEEEKEKMEINKSIESSKIDEIEGVEQENTPKQNKSEDSEVVDGLELSVECASDKEASSSESDKERDTKPRPKTIIVKAKPNDSELEVGSSEAEKSDIDDQLSDNHTSNRKQMGKRKSFSEVDSSQSGKSLESNSDDEDYSPRKKKKLKKSITPKKATPQKTKARKEQESRKQSVTNSEDERSESRDEEMNLAERAKKMSNRSTDKSTEKDESDSESMDEADSDDDTGIKNKKNGEQRSRKMDPKDDKRIKSLKKYLTTAGIRVKFEELWSGCKSNKQRADRIKTLLEKSGIVGRPTLEKCRKLKVKNETKKEVAELDTSNIISEGRITRARRTEANKAGSGTPTKQRETRKLLKRIQPVCDSDTE